MLSTLEEERNMPGLTLKDLDGGKLQRLPARLH